MKEILKIGNIDVSAHIQRKGYGWTRNDLDSEKTKRTKDGKLRRYKITEKRTLTYSLIDMTRAELAALDDALSASTFQATYLDLHGVATRTFYCSSFTATLAEAYEDDEAWEGAEFTLIEV